MAKIRRSGESATMSVRCVRWVRLIALVAVPAFSSALPMHAEPAPATYQVVIEQMRFNPPTLTVKRGDRVQWVNRDLFAHTASSSTNRFDSGSIAPNASWTYVVGQSGSYPYLCTLHPTMRGTLNVR